MRLQPMTTHYAHTKLFVIFDQLVDLVFRHLVARLQRLRRFSADVNGLGWIALVCWSLAGRRNDGSIEGRHAARLTACLLSAGKIRNVSRIYPIVHALPVRYSCARGFRRGQITIVR